MGGAPPFPSSGETLLLHLTPAMSVCSLDDRLSLGRKRQQSATFDLPRKLVHITFEPAHILHDIFSHYPRPLASVGSVADHWQQRL